MSREKFHETIYVEKAKDLRSNLTMSRPCKCGSIMSGFGKCCDCRQSQLLCDLPRVLTDKSQVCAVELVLLEYFVSNIETLRESLV